MYTTAKYYNESGELTGIIIRVKIENADIDLIVENSNSMTIAYQEPGAYPVLVKIKDLKEFNRAIQHAMAVLNKGE